MRNTFQKVLKCLKPCVSQTTVKCAAAIVVLLTYIIYTVREDSYKDIHEELLKGFAALGVGFGAQAVVNDVIFLCKEFFTLVARGRRLQNNKINFRLINDVRTFNSEHEQCRSHVARIAWNILVSTIAGVVHRSIKWPHADSDQLEIFYGFCSLAIGYAIADIIAQSMISGTKKCVKILEERRSSERQPLVMEL